MATRMQEKVSTNGQRGRDAAAWERSPGRRRVRVPELLVGSLVVAGFALAAVLWQASSVERQPALALASDLERGEILTADDLEVVYVDVEGELALLSPDVATSLIGQVALTDLDAGTLATATHFSDEPVLRLGEGVVGLALDPGQFPSPALRPGDLVNVVLVTDAPSDPEAATGDRVLIEAVEVFAVQELGSQGRRFIALKMSESDANAVASAATRAEVRLVLVTREAP